MLAKRIDEGFRYLEAGDPEAAFIPCCIAIAATARQELPHVHADHEAFKSFLQPRMALITACAFGNVAMLNMRLHFQHDEIKPGADGLCSLEQILYHVIRCGLIHQGRLDPAVALTADGSLHLRRDGVLELPSTLVVGLLLAVVTSPTNADARLLEPRDLNFGNRSIPIDELWGRADRLEQLLGR